MNSLTSKALTNAAELTPDSTGIENGVAFVQFNNIQSFSTFGYSGSTGACNAGSNDPAITPTTASNTCPATTVNLTSLASTGTTPAGTTLIWSTHVLPTSVSDTLTTTQASAVNTSGTYYALFYDSTNGCYSPADSVAVSIAICPTILCSGDGKVDYSKWVISGLGSGNSWYNETNAATTHLNPPTANIKYGDVPGTTSIPTITGTVTNNMSTVGSS